MVQGAPFQQADCGMGLLGNSHPAARRDAVAAVRPAGDPEALGSGTVPLDLVADKPSLARGITDAFDTVRVKHESGGNSTIRFRSYQAGREAFQGVTLDLIIFDEEPPPDVYAEGITRITATNGRALLVYTPMGGPGEVTRRFTQDAPDRA